MLNELFSDKFLFKDPGGPLWSQLRSYYNLRTENDPEEGKLKDRVQTDDRFGLNPLSSVSRYSMFRHSFTTETKDTESDFTLFQC